MKIYEYTLRGWVHPADIFVALFSSDQAAFWLDREFHPTKRLSIIGHAYAGRVVSADEVVTALENPDSSFGNANFTPGFVGWLEYPNQPLPEYETVSGSFLEVREAIVFNHDNRTISLVGAFATELLFDDWVSALLLRMGVMGGQKEAFQFRAIKPQVESVSVRHNRDQYLALIEHAKRKIAEGDVYQLCLTNQITAFGSFDPLEVFLRLRISNAAPYSCFIRVGARVLVSSSPEQFFNLSDNLVTTKPIKGTRPRFIDPELDAASARELQENEKERAENLMIVDLMRNDLSKFCRESSVQVTSLFAVESYSTVHQLVSTVTGELAISNPMRALLSAFPGGSMTGAPKFRAQQLISEFEAGKRGVYSGVAGSVGLDGSIDMAMNIRCLVFEGDSVSIGVGGGITADSIAEDEFAETQLKASALIDVLGASVYWN